MVDALEAVVLAGQVGHPVSRPGRVHVRAGGLVLGNGGRADVVRRAAGVLVDLGLAAVGPLQRRSQRRLRVDVHHATW